MIGTCLVILGVVILSSGNRAKGDWQKKDVIYPVLAAMAFGISTTLRKTGLTSVPVPILAAAVTVGTAFVVLVVIIQFRGGLRMLKLSRKSAGWLFTAALVNTGAILSFFYALNFGQIVRVEPLVACNPLLTILWTGIFLRQIEQLSGRIVLGAFVTVTGTVLVVTAR